MERGLVPVVPPATLVVRLGVGFLASQGGKRKDRTLVKYLKDLGRTPDSGFGEEKKVLALEPASLISF